MRLINDNVLPWNLGQVLAIPTDRSMRKTKQKEKKVQHCSLERTDFVHVWKVCFDGDAYRSRMIISYVVMINGYFSLIVLGSFARMDFLSSGAP